jgi:translation initiation factor 3 subunit M
VNYVVRNRSDEDRAAFIKPFQDILKTDEGQKPLEKDEPRQRKIFSMVLSEVKGLGDGSEKGVSSFFCVQANATDRHSEIEGFFNLLYSHLFVLYPADSSEAKQYLTTLLHTISSSPSEQALIKYRMSVPHCIFANYLFM